MHDLGRYVFPRVTSSIFLIPCSESEIFVFLRSSRNNTAAGNDYIKVEPIKPVADLLCSPLRHICNNALATETFPDGMKIARVAILHKGGILDNINNYRPIYVLPLFSDELEHVIKT